MASTTALVGELGHHHDPRGIDHGEPVIEGGKTCAAMVAREVEQVGIGHLAMPDDVAQVDLCEYDKSSGQARS